MSKEAYYFSHDSNARHDPKILGLMSQFGMEGYGRYWVLIEMLREQENYKLKKSKYLFNALAMQMQCSADAAHSFASACINEHELLVEDEEFIWSESLLKRMEKRNEKSEKAKKAAEARWNKPRQNNDSKKSPNPQSERNADAMQTQSERNALKEKKEKESKRKENIKDEEEARTSEFNPFTFYEENGFGVMPPMVIEEINQWIDDSCFEEPKAIIIEAMKEAVRNDKKSWNYVNKILINWSDHKVKTHKEALISIEQWKNKRKSTQRQPRRQEPMPKSMSAAPEQMDPQEEEELRKRLEEKFRGA